MGQFLERLRYFERPEELRKRSEERALSQYVRVLAANVELEGVELDAAASPLVQ
jgi:hypothetical protein